ncbi:MAG: 3-isopropylmalate dehydrogenase [Acidobacteriia bacterium]|nr:3-isopropylmalate dehydrogenase [Terriglobia bacterium]
MKLTLTILPGDGIGPEVTAEALKALQAIGQRFGHLIETQSALIGGAALDALGIPLPDETIKTCENSDAVLLGAIGGPRWDRNPPALKPESGLLGIRKALGNYANLRPARIFTALKGASTLKPEVIEGVDLLIVRELTGGIYFGKPRGFAGGGATDGNLHDSAHKVIEVKDAVVGFNTEIYSVGEIERIVRMAIELARSRRRRICSVDKANVLESSQLWRHVAARLAATCPDVQFTFMYVDNCAMQLVANPAQFDVIVTSNLFGDILSDEAAMLTGSIGMLPSACVGGRVPLFEPVHGSAPDIAGQNLANPLAAILSVAMMFQYTFHLSEEARTLERAVESVLAEGFRTRDLLSSSVPGITRVSCNEMGDRVVNGIMQS